MASGIQIMFERSYGSYQRRRRGIALIAIVFVTLVALELVDVPPASAVATPTVTAVSPDAGSVNTSVTIAGTGFVSGDTVAFGTSAATNVVVVSATSITATSPAGTGTVDVTVYYYQNQTSAFSALDLFSYGAPTVTAVSPDAGSVNTSVTITGTNFASPTTPSFVVKFGTAAATGVVVNSSTSISATSPAGTGTVNVTVTTSNGPSATSGSDLFLYGTAGPTVTTISPDAGSILGGTSVTITGTNFASGAIVFFGSMRATNVTVNSSTSITALSPAGTGTVDVTVTTANDTSATSGADLFTYGTPTVSSVSPDAGSTSGGTSVAIIGTNFASSTATASERLGILWQRGESQRKPLVKCSRMVRPTTRAVTISVGPDNDPRPYDVGQWSEE